MKEQSELGLTSTSTTITPHSSRNDVAGDAGSLQLNPRHGGRGVCGGKTPCNVRIKRRVGALCRRCLVRRADLGRSTCSQTRLIGRSVRSPLRSIENCTALVRSPIVSPIDALRRNCNTLACPQAIAQS